MAVYDSSFYEGLQRLVSGDMNRFFFVTRNGRTLRRAGEPEERVARRLFRVARALPTDERTRTRAEAPDDATDPAARNLMKTYGLLKFNID